MRIKRVTTIMALAATVGLPASAGAQHQDLRNPDQQAPVPGDYRSQDLRMPDRQAPEPAIVPDSPQPVVRYVDVPEADRFDWADAGVGAAGGLAILALTAGTGVAVASRRREGHLRPTIG
jgi:hypothetical protein